MTVVMKNMTMNMSVTTNNLNDMREIDHKTAWNFLQPRHYAGRKPSISVAFGWFVDGILQAVVTFGKPASPSLCKGICGEEFSHNVYELNRMCRAQDFHEPLSKFVAWCLRQLKQRDWIIVSYSDTQMNHHGYVYQACNFLYTGCTKQRTDKYAGDGKHSRHYDRDAKEEYRQIRYSKHRYVFWCTNSKRIKKLWEKSLRYPIMSYPKGDNSNYILGEYIKQNLIKVDADDAKEESKS